VILVVIVKEIMDELTKKHNNVSDRRIHQIISKLQEDRHIVDHGIAGYVLAFEKGIKIQKYLDKDTVAKVQKAMHDGPKVVREKVLVKAKSKPNLILRIGKDFDIDHPVLPKRIAEEAAKMSEVYPYFYVFENSVRSAIQRVMEKNYGLEWMAAKATTQMKKKAETRIALEGKNRWHGKRGALPINYLDIEDLADIITTNWQDFEKLFPSQHWVKATIEIVTLSRNVVAHNNPLSDDDIESVRVRFREWTNQVKDIEEMLR